jgi:hypothetical protein
METATFDIFEISATIDGAKEYNREGLDHQLCFLGDKRWVFFWSGSLHLTGVHSHLSSIFIETNFIIIRQRATNLIGLFR